MKLLLLAGSANPALADDVGKELGVAPARRTIECFPDGEIHAELMESVRGCDAYILQPTGPPVSQNFIELLLLADVCRRSGARRLTAMTTYLGYARQDRRVRGGEPVALRVMGDIIGATGFDRVVAIDVHARTVEGFFPVPVENLSAAPILADALRPWVDERTIIVAPDLGAVALSERYARALDRPIAIVHKMRLDGERVTVRDIVGDVAGRAPLIVDDMVTTGGTIEAAAHALLAHGCLPELLIAATHMVMVRGAAERLRLLAPRAVVATDTLASARAQDFPFRVASVAPLLARTIERLHEVDC